MTTQIFEHAPVPYDGQWPQQFARLSREIREGCVPYDAIEKLDHIGSTSIAGLMAKPILDVLIEVRPGAKYIEQLSRTLVASGFTDKGENGIPGRAYFSRAARKAEAGVARSSQQPRAATPPVHVHVFPTGHEALATHLAFRDYLRAHPKVTALYEALKRKILATPDVTRDAYQEKKAAFLDVTTREALSWYATHDLKEGRKRKPKKKVVIYVTRAGADGVTELLVFDHANPTYPNSSPQVPSGSVDKKEEIPLAAERELFEEAGLRVGLSELGSYVFYKAHLDRFQDRHHYHGRAVTPLPDAWTHVITGDGNDQNQVLKYYWLPLNEAREKLQAELGRGLEYFGVS